MDAVEGPDDWDRQGLELMRAAVDRAEPVLLMEAIGLFRRSLDAGRGDQTYLAGAFGHLYELTADPRALQMSVSSHRLALQSDPDNPRLLSNLGQALTRSFELTDDIATIREAVQVLRTAAGRSVGSRSDALRSSNLGAALIRLHERTGELQVLDEAIEAHLEATRPGVSDPALRAALEVNLANVLLLAYRNTGARVRLDTAVSAYKRAVAAVPPEHPHAAGCHAGLGDALLETVQADSSEELLRDAIVHLRHAVDLGENAPADLPLYLRHLGSALRVQYTMRGDAAALEEAVKLFSAAAVIGPAHGGEAAESVRALARALRDRFESGGEFRHVEEAERMIRALLAGMPDQHPQWLRCREDLAMVLLSRGEHTHDAVVLAEAAELLRASVEAAPPGHPLQFSNLVNLGVCLISGATESANEELASEAVATLQTALTSATTERNRANGLINLAGALGARFRLAGDPADDERAARIRTKLIDAQAVPPLLRGMAARDLGNQRARSGDYKAATEAFGRAMELLDLVVWSGLERDDQERLLAAQFPGLSTAAAGCAIRSGDPERAVDLLERGRNVLISRAMQIPIDSAGSHRLRPAASEGPIVMANVSEHGCDALIVTVDGIQVVPLPGLSASTATGLAVEFLGAIRRNDWESNTTVFAVLEQLWDVLTGPVLEALSLHKVNRSGGSRPGHSPYCRCMPPDTTQEVPAYRITWSVPTHPRSWHCRPLARPRPVQTVRTGL